jgi:tRNA A-37 threonylcarbamoyl transferase component Bud32
MSLMDERRNERFGRYEILAEQGRGAMGIVYKARDPKINRVVAVKTITLAGQPQEEEQEYRERFFREAEAAGRLSHPGIVTIFDVGEEPDTRAPYIVMEFVNGQSLDKLLSGEYRKLPLETALRLAHELAEALDCAHGQGVVHRDLKPANILVTDEGHAKIADFGIAKLNLANQTLAGRALGTPAYMSPEQLNGESVDGRSDLFSLGVVLYTILTGYRPFQGNSALTVSFKIVNRDPVPATILETQLPQGVDYIINRAMAKDPAQRYQRGMEMALDIQDLIEGRELWSKAKKHDSSTPAVMPLGGEGPAGAAALPRPVVRPKSQGQGQAVAERVLDNMRKNFLVSALLLVGVLLFAVRVGRFVRPQAPPVQHIVGIGTAEPMPMAQNISNAKVPLVSPTPPANENTATAIPPEASPVAALTTPKIPHRTHTIAAKADQATLAASSPAAASTATLDIEVEHHFAEAHLSIWIDGHLSYSHLLDGVDKKHLVVFHHIQGHEFHAMQVPTGNHHLRVEVTSEANSTDKSGEISGAFAIGNEKMLHIRFDKHGEMDLSLDN